MLSPKTENQQQQQEYEGEGVSDGKNLLHNWLIVAEVSHLDDEKSNLAEDGEIDSSTDRKKQVHLRCEQQRREAIKVKMRFLLLFPSYIAYTTQLIN